MGKVIAKKIDGMNLMAKISLVLMITILTSVFMYQGFFKPNSTQADVTVNQVWSSVYTGVAFPGSYTYAIITGPNRKLIVALSSTTSTAATQTVSVTYGGKTLTQGAGDTSSTNSIQHSYLFYLDEADIAAASDTALAVSVTGGTAVFNTVYAAVYSGAAASVSTPANYNSLLTSSSAPTFNPTLLSIAAGDLAVEAINVASVTGAAPTISTYASGWSQALGNNTAYGNATTPGVGSYAAANIPAVGSSTTTYSAHTASGNGSISMSAFIITKAPGSAAVTSLAPATIFRDGTQYTLTINGSGFTGTTALALATVDTNITFGNFSVVDDTQITVPVTVATTANIGNRTLVITTPVGVSSYLATSFVGSNNPAPVISAFNPTQIGLGNSSMPVTITGTGFLAGASVAFIPPSNVTFSNLSVDNDTSISLLLTLGSSAASTAYTATVTNSDLKASNIFAAFNAKPAPTALAATPFGLPPGSTSDVTLFGTGFAPGATVAIGNGTRWVESSGTTEFISINSVKLKAVKIFDNASTARAISFKVTNTDGGSSTGSNIMQTISSVGTWISSVISNTLGASSGIHTIKISGSAFENVSSVSFSSGNRGTLGKPVYDSGDGSLTVPVTAGSNGLGTLSLISKTGSTLFSGVAGSLYITNAPTVTAIQNGVTLQAFGVIGNAYDLTISGTNFQYGASLALINPATLLPVNGVAITGVTAISSTVITLHIAIDAGVTELGLHNLIITNPDYGNVTTQFNVQSATPPTVTSIVPASIGQGAINVPVTITGTNFTATPTVLFGATGNTNFTVSNLTWVSSTQLTANLSIATGATAAATNITVTNPNEEAAIGTGLLTVTARPGTATTNPTTAQLGSSQTFTITTSGLVIGAPFNITGDTGVTVTLPAYGSATSATANVSIDALYTNAPLGNHTLTLTNGDYGIRTANYTVTGLVPTVASISPSSAKLSATSAPIVITGTNFYPGATVALGNSTGITIASQTYVNDTTINATLSLAIDATVGPADIKVTNTDSQVGIGTGLLSTAAAPTVTSNTPLTGGQGSTLNVTISGTSFDSGAAVLFSGTGITVNSVSGSGTTLIANITIAADALQTERSVTVTNPDGSNAAGGSFTVTLPDATTVGALSFYQVTTNSITVAASFTKDGNNNNSCVIKWGTVDGAYPNTATVVKGTNAFTATITGLPAGTEGSGNQFFFQATFTDTDGIIGTNPAVGSQSTSGSLLLHNNLNTASEKWSQGWGTAEGQYGVISCVTCHSKTTANSKLVAGAFTTTGTWVANGTSSLQVIYNSTTPLGTDDTHASSTKACEACHTKTNHHKYNNVAANHERNVDCLTCHSHKEAFMPTCSTCHSTAQAQGNRRQVLGNGGDFFSNMSTHGRFTNSSSQACAVCHYGNDHKTLSDGVSVKLKNADSGAPVLFDGTTATATALKNACISCHDANGATILGANALSPFAITGETRQPANINQYWAASGGAHDSKMVCMNCHGNSKGVDGNTANPKYNAHASGSKSILQDAGYDVKNPNNYCSNCHNSASTDPNKSGKDIAAQLALTNKHVTAKCFDCHGDENNAVSSVHQLLPGSQTAGTGVMAQNISKATGRNMTYASNSWGGATASSSLPSGTATAEYQVCFKCHANTGTGTTPAVPGAGTAAASLTNLALEFNPNNKSGHPIVTGLNNYPNSAAPKALTAAKMKAPWNVNLGTQVMTCSDCHATDSAASKGPHGSSVKWMLAGTNKAWPYTASSANGSGTGTLFRLASYNTGDGTANGLFCLNCHTVNASNNWHADGELVVSGGEHTTNASGPAACASCHIRVPHGGKIARLLVTTNAPARYLTNGSSGTPIYTQWGPTTGTIKGTTMSNSNFNSSCAEHSGSGGEAW